MWVEVKRVPNLMLAEMWKELLEGEGIPTRILAYPDPSETRELATYRILVSEEKMHVIEEILRKL